MAPPFSFAEYKTRADRVRQVMKNRGLDALVIGCPANINWLTGYDAWSFYTPQMMLVDMNDNGLYWFGREMDSGAAKFTSYLTGNQIIGYPEDFVQRPDSHPFSYVADWLNRSGYNHSVIGFESDSYFTSPRSIQSLQSNTKNITWIDADLLVNWVRVIKSRDEICMMRKAASIADIAMDTAFKGTDVGVRKCDLMANIVAAQIRGKEDFGGDLTALHPLILAGESASTAHPLWTDAKLKSGQTIAFELGGCCKRYNVGLARTVHLGKKKPKKLIETSKAVKEGMQAVMDTMHADVATGEVHKAWQKVLDSYGLEKKSRIGYSIGVGYPPDWGEHTLSVRADEKTVVPENAVVHIILGMWMDGWGMELSETLHVKKRNCVRLSKLSQDVQLIEG